MKIIDRVERFYSWVLTSSLARNCAAEEKNRFFHYTVLSLLGIPTMVYFGASHLVSGNTSLGGLVLFSAAALVAGWFFQWKTGRGLFVYRLNAFIFGGMLIYSVRFGPEESAILWSYTFPLLALFLMSAVEGVLSSAIFLVALLIFLSNDPSTFFSTSFKVRFVISYLFVGTISFWFEVLRVRYRTGMEKRTIQLDREKLELEKAMTEKTETEKEKDALIVELKKTLQEVDTLRGFLPICSYCHKIRDDEGYWNRLEEYLEQRADISFSHGICPGCRDEHFPEYKNECAE